MTRGSEQTDPPEHPLDGVLAGLTVDPASGTAPYEQVRVGLAAAVADGRLPRGTRLPTVGALAERLGLATNTAARVYRELEADGVVRTEGRRGTFVGDAAPDDAAVLAAAAAYVAAARAAGLGLVEARLLVDRAWTAS